MRASSDATALSNADREIVWYRFRCRSAIWAAMYRRSCRQAVTAALSRGGVCAAPSPVSEATVRAARKRAVE